MDDYVEQSSRDTLMDRMDRHLEQALLETMMVIGAMNQSLAMKNEESANLQTHAIKKLLQVARASLESAMDLRSLARGNLAKLGARDNHHQGNVDRFKKELDFVDLHWSRSGVPPRR